MSKEIFEKYQKFVVSEKTRYDECPIELMKTEKVLFHFLSEQPKEKNRLEQEYVPEVELNKILKNV